MLVLGFPDGLSLPGVAPHEKRVRPAHKRWRGGLPDQKGEAASGSRRPSSMVAADCARSDARGDHANMTAPETLPMNIKILSTTIALAAIGLGLSSCAHDTAAAVPMQPQAEAPMCTNRPQVPPVSQDAKGQWGAIASEFNRTIAAGATGIYVSSLQPVDETVEFRVSYVPNLLCTTLFTETCAVPLGVARQVTIESGGFIVFAASDGSSNIQHRVWVYSPVKGSYETVEQVARCILPFESATKLVGLLSQVTVEQTNRD